MRTLVLFTRDLRVHDHPALTEAIPTSPIPAPWRDPALLQSSGYPEPLEPVPDR